MHVRLRRRARRVYEMAGVVGTIGRATLIDRRRVVRLSQQGKFEEAYQLARDEVERMERVFLSEAARLGSPEKVDEAKSAILGLQGAATGELLLHLGDYRGALPALDAALAAFESVEDGRPKSRFRLYRLKSVAHQALGDHEQAWAVLRPALTAYLDARTEIIQKVPERVGLRRLYKYLVSWDGDTASYILECAELAATTRLDTDAASLLDQLLAGFHMTRKFRLQEQCLRASIARLQGNLAEADSILTSALQRAADRDQLVHEPWKPLVELASVRFDRGACDEARDIQQAALDLVSEAFSPEHPLRQSITSKLAQILAACGETSAAAALLLDITCRNQSLYDIVSVVSQQQRLRYLARQRADVFRLINLLLDEEAVDPSIAGAVYTAVLRSKGIDFDAELIRSRVLALPEHARLLPQVQRLDDLRARIGQKTLAGPGLEGTAEHHRLLGKWRREALDLESNLVRAIPEMLLTQAQLSTITSMQDSLPADGALVEFFRTADQDGGDSAGAGRYVAFILRPDSVSPTIVGLGTAAEIDGLIAQFRQHMAALKSDRKQQPESLYASAGPLYRQLVAPLRPHLEDVGHLLIAPDAALSQIPFETLCETPLRLLWKQYAISYLTTGRDLLRQPSLAPKAGRSKPFVAGAPDFDLASPGSATVPTEQQGRVHKPVGDTRAEVESVARLLNTEPVLGAAVLKTVLVSLSGPPVLHLATHGEALARSQARVNNPARSVLPEDETQHWGLAQANRLALAGANAVARGHEPAPGAQDGFLSANDVLRMDLNGTELVTLSACSAGQGAIASGEAPTGLRSSFLIAGADSLLLALWQVHAKATNMLMTEFYQQLLTVGPNGEPTTKLKALRAAQARLRSTPEFRQPYYWAGFVLVGHSGPVRIKVETPPEFTGQIRE